MRKPLFGLALMLIGFSCTTDPSRFPIRVTGINGAALIVKPGGHSEPVRKGDELRPTLYFQTTGPDDRLQLGHVHAKIDVSGTLAIEASAGEVCKTAIALRPINGRIHYRSEDTGHIKPGCTVFILGKTTLIAPGGANLRFAVVDGFTIGLLTSGHVRLTSTLRNATDKETALAAGEYFLVDPRAIWLRHTQAAAIAEVIQHELRSLDGYRTVVLHQELMELMETSE